MIGWPFVILTRNLLKIADYTDGSVFAHILCLLKGMRMHSKD